MAEKADPCTEGALPVGIRDKRDPLEDCWLEQVPGSAPPVQSSLPPHVLVPACEYKYAI